MTLFEFFNAVLPTILLMPIALIIVTYVPVISMFLPNIICCGSCDILKYRARQSHLDQLARQFL